MTREEAKEALSVLKIYDAQWLREAVDMAIEALTNVQNMHKGKWIKKQVFNPELDKYVPLRKNYQNYRQWYCKIYATQTRTQDMSYWKKSQMYM